MALGKKTGGRQKGTPNKTTASVKAASESAFNQLGGVKALVKWAQDDPGEFFKLYSKLLPIEMRADVNYTGLDALAERLARASKRAEEPQKEILGSPSC